MTWIALRMLTGDRSKFLGLIVGVTFATLLMSRHRHMTRRKKRLQYESVKQVHD